MENQFSIDRMMLLARSIFIQNKSKDLRLALVIAGVMAVVGLLLSITGTYHILFGAEVIVWMVMAGTTYKMMSNQPRAMAYLTLPASTAEKAVVTIAYLNIYYFVLIAASSFIGFYLGQILHNAIAILPFFRDIVGSPEGHTFSLSSVEFSSDNPSKLLYNMMWVSILLFGSIYFKKYAILKTLLTACIFGFAIFILDIIVISFASAALDLSSMNHMNFPDIPEWIENVVYYAVPCLFTLFFWFMTYLRLRETEA